MLRCFRRGGDHPFANLGWLGRPPAVSHFDHRGQFAQTTIEVLERVGGAGFPKLVFSAKMRTIHLRPNKPMSGARMQLKRLWDFVATTAMDVGTTK